ncbi:tRNA (adenosine(37)-N6)-threonylcarbamoyltransferase complex ATPase subunit type 1 TsaE [Oceanobacillus bengalensis]|uniref:tRNA threonylcarbamoyladenosine biosynthesis protein TsaE n=1 Tax=Oceanobacillus bengalensis TaxID=1435466 RepID=A0A494YTF1_9BACI|nr:tRNA (adenosine(37)-N6)-threonylcarbamoyltransferase complex ATPase subunit type 1 TsaE [Oceanobacillus bengalensis]RKQ13392.1 tRNA (adenosine(37)-N6)-threonylcarbamoyltransferase complex ATPase subunit type 1 TsaE [Oceanobacillus bengalensis]
MNKLKINTNTVQETMLIGEKLAKMLRAGDVLTLEGELGAGKTTFTKGIAKGLGITRNVSSPTFTIVKEYEGNLPLYHMDVYRLEHSDEDIGFDEYFNGNGVTVVEWASFIEEYLPEHLLNIRINYGEEGSRVLEFTTNSTHFESIVNELP